MEKLCLPASFFRKLPTQDRYSQKHAVESAKSAKRPATLDPKSSQQPRIQGASSASEVDPEASISVG